MKTFDAKALGARICRIRQEYGLQQKEAAERVNISLSYYGNIERGKRTPSLDILVRIANGLGVGTDTLLRDSLEKPCLPKTHWTDRELGIVRQLLEQNGENAENWLHMNELIEDQLDSQSE